jgi:AraC-like DNA-binding protein
MAAAPIVLVAPLIESLPEAHHRGFHVRGFRKSCVDFHFHFHLELELVHVVRGRGVRYVGHSVEPFSDGDFCLIGSNLPHAFGSHPSDRNGAEWIVAHFLPERWGASFWELPEARRIRRLLLQSQRGVWFDAKEARACLKLFRALESMTLGGRRLAAWLEILDRLASFHVRRFLNPEACPSGEPLDQRLKSILAWIDENASGEILQADAARALKMSPQAFCRYFRQKTGKVFHRYVSEVRVARGCSDLLHSDIRVSEIAFQSGFNNLSNFNRRFREITGKTPLQYRATHGGLV